MMTTPDAMRTLVSDRQTALRNAADRRRQVASTPAADAPARSGRLWWALRRRPATASA
jgi:hypothetical protein